MRTLLAIVLVLSSVPLVPKRAAADDVSLGVRIQSMVDGDRYVDGEAIVIVRSHAQVETSPQTEDLAVVNANTLRATAEDAKRTENATGEEVALRAQSIQADTFEVKLVVDHGRSTEQLLRDLYADPDVISAEPNYTASAEAFGDEELWPDEGAAGQGVAGKPAASPSTESPLAEDPAATAPATDGPLSAQSEPAAAGLRTQATTSPRDLTPLQWYADKSLSTDDIANTPISPTTGYSLNVTGWLEGRTNQNAPANASGTVCIMDTGIDATHPDLAGLLYKFSPEDQQKYGCGEYGYNASDDGLGTNYLRASVNHGTHLAGIVAAEWNDQGVSGISHGTRVFCVNLFGGDGTWTTVSSIIKGFQFLVDVATETNLKAVNCSWDLQQPMFVLTAMMNELGKRGVNTVFAASNLHEDNDERMSLNGEVATSPYVIAVGSAMASGKPSEFSNYGQTTVHVYAPGSNIMSTVPELISRQVDRQDKTKQHDYARYTHYFPQATAAENNLAYETFADDPGVRVFKENPATNAAAEEITSQLQVVEGVGYGDRRALAIPVSELNKQAVDPQTTFGAEAVNGYAYLAIPVASAEVARQVKWASVNMAMSDAFNPAGSLESVTCVKDDGTGAPVEVDTAATKAIDTADDTHDIAYKGWAAAAGSSISQTQWTCYSYSVDGLAGAYNSAHEPAAGVGDVYAWQSDNKTYVIAKVAMGREKNAVKAADDTLLYVDNVALGNTDAYTGANQNMSGTSMSTPVVAGCLAVIAKDERENAQLSADELELQSRERAAKLLASVEYDEDLGTLCRTGGRVNLAQNPGFTKKAPLLYRAESDGSALTISGCFFGTGGTLAIDDKPAAVSSWDEGRITADVSRLGNGSHVAKVVTADGCVMRIVFAQSEGPQATDTGTLPLYENNLAVPAGVPGYEKDDCPYGPLVGCGGYIFAQTATIINHAAQGFWRYDIANDTWSRHDLPQGYGAPANQGVAYGLRGLNKGGMVAYHDTLYLVGLRRDETEKAYIGTLWRYDISKDAWEIVDLQIPFDCSLVVMDDDLLAIGGSYEGIFQGDDADVRAAKIDVDGKKLIPVAGAESLDGIQLSTVATSRRIYVYEDVRDATTNRNFTRFSRLTYDKGAAKLSVEDLTAACDATGLAIDTSKGAYGAEVHVALAGLPEGVALVGAAMKDDGLYVLGRDTHIILDDATEATTFDRTSSYYRPFDPMATYYDGKLYVAAQSAPESDAMYFRSTQVAKPVTYAVVAGDGSTWVKGSVDALTFTAKRSEADDQTFGRFVGASVDGNAVDAESFEAKAGSLVLSLKPAYLQGLEAKAHKIELAFDDGTATATFTVANAADDDSGKQDDSGDKDDSGKQGGSGTGTQDDTGTQSGIGDQGGLTGGGSGSGSGSGSQGSSASGTQGATRGTTTVARTADASVSPGAFLLISAVAILVGARIRKRGNRS